MKKFSMLVLSSILSISVLMCGCSNNGENDGENAQLTQQSQLSNDYVHTVDESWEVPIYGTNENEQSFAPATNAPSTGDTLLSDDISTIGQTEPSDGEMSNTNESDTTESGLDGEVTLKKPVVFVGGTRFNDMVNAIAGKTKVNYTDYTQNGAGLDYVKEIMPNLYDLENYYIVINFDINEVNNATECVSFLNSVPAEFMDNNQMIFVNMLPVNDAECTELGLDISNIQIANFNEYVKNNLSFSYKVIDSNSSMMLKGFESVSGAQYSENSTIDFYLDMLTSIKNGDYLNRK